MNIRMKSLTVALLLAVPLLATAEQVAIVGGTIHTLSAAGTLQDATLLIEDGQIKSIKPGKDVPAGARVIDATGKVVTPGLFAAISQLGLVEVSAVEGSVDYQQRGADFAASFEVADAYNPASSLVDVNRIEGVTRAVIAPSFGYGAEHPGMQSSIISGTAALVHLGVGDDYLSLRKVALIAHFGETGSAFAGGSRAAALLQLTSALEDAIDYAANREAFDAGARRQYSVSRADLEALQSVVRGETPVYLSANRASDIRVAIELADRFGLKLIIVGGAEAVSVADRLAASNVAVVFSPLDNLPSSFDALGASVKNASRLHEAGVRIIFADGDSHNLRNMTQLAGNAVAHGLPWIEGLRAVTSTPAQVLGLGDKFGTLSVGKVADVVIWDGDPLEVTTFADHVFIDGIEMPMSSRQTLLRDRYLAAPDDMPHHYRDTR